MKDLLLINNNLLLEFWAKAIDTTNYLQNRLLTKNQKGEMIPEEI